MAKELQNTRIKNIHCTGRGHWRIIVEQEHWMRKYPFGLSSITLWEYTTTDSMAIDDYKSDDYQRQRNGEHRLIRQAKAYGTKIVERYR
jgi:hypothetical protein